MKTRLENINKTKKDIMDAFWELYCQKRIEKITVKEITQKAGYNRSTFYQYFVDVYDVLEQIENEVIPNITELPPLSLSNVQVGMPLDVFMKLFERNSKYYFVLLGDNGDPAFTRKLKNSIKGILKEAIRIENKIDETELDYILEYTLSAMIGVMTYWFKEGQNLPAKELVKLINMLMENGVISKFKQKPQ